MRLPGPPADRGAVDHVVDDGADHVHERQVGPVDGAPGERRDVRTSDDPAPDDDGTGGAGGTGVAPAGPAGRAFNTEITFYSAYDNDPPGSRAIAYPNARHSQAGGTGTFADPLTLASDPREIAVGTVVYVPLVKKYFVMEDDCAECISDWGGSKVPHLDLFMPNGNDDSVTACQEQLTPAGRVTVELNPPAGRAVSSGPLYSGGRCFSG
ncbi:MAG: hypothetical protein ABT15_30405 [Pseudonocardia sp. SCN 73-27]|uniref:hypothetical protein n=1 Tax=Pseudonocardia sp. SCN 73-27 TaxID=1660132 RepID=UPI00086C2C19|nr:hypothetical protein [Pseudonocardia sp. SCN 73-27]ODV00119.1 MAG: hypothetical protein ABT15_30405 [Pseudonocardia sp. SCN 73-27]